MMEKTVLLAIIMLALYSCSLENKDIQEQTIIVDVGSTGTRIRLYSLVKTNGGEDDEGMYVRDSPDDYRLPALTSLSPDRTMLYTRFCDVIVKKAVTMVTMDPSDVKLYIMATAGMRGVSEYNTTLIMNIVRSYFNDTTRSKFRFQNNDCRILSGEEEAAFAWIAVNYVKRNIGERTKQSRSVGILEMGGASMQIAFESRKAISAHNFPIKIGNIVHSIYTYSYYSLGMSFLTDNILSQLKLTERTLNPCTLTGLLLWVISIGRDESGGYQGSGNFSDCLNIIDAAMQLKSTTCILKPCGIRSVYQPSIDEKTSVFYTLGVFRIAIKSVRKYLSSEEFHSVNSPPILNGEINKLQLEIATKYFCSKDLNFLKKKGIKQKYASDDCLGSIYLLKIMQELGFDDLNKIDGFTIDKDDLIKPDWTLGAVIYEKHKYNTCLPNDYYEVTNNSAGINTTTFYSLWLMPVISLLYNYIDYFNF